MCKIACLQNYRMISYIAKTKLTLEQQKNIAIDCYNNKEKYNIANYEEECKFYSLIYGLNSDLIKYIPNEYKNYCIVMQFF